MVVLKEIQGSNSRIDEHSIPRVSVFVGATGGIGKAVLTEYVTASKGHGDIRVYVVGRWTDPDKVSAFLDPLRKSSPNAQLVWVEGEVALLAEVRRISQQIATKETSLDLLYLSPGYVAWDEHDRTAEGLRTSLALQHYCRILFMLQMMPLLKASPHGRIVTVYSGGFETAQIDLDDLNLDKPGNFGPIRSQTQAGTMLSVCMDQLAEENRAVTFIHNHPGGVDTGNLTRALGGDRWMLRSTIWAVTRPVFWLIGYSDKEAGERTLYLLTSAKYGGKGVPLGSAQSPGLTNRGKEQGGLFLASMKEDTVTNEKVWETLRTEAKDVIWTKTMDVLKPYL